MSNTNSSQHKDPTRRTPMSPTESDCSLEIIADGDVDVGVWPTPIITTPTVVSGRRSIGNPHTGVRCSDTVCKEGGQGSV